jgi:hypothetical protein
MTYIITLFEFAYEIVNEILHAIIQPVLKASKAPADIMIKRVGKSVGNVK